LVLLLLLLLLLLLRPDRASTRPRLDFTSTSSHPSLSFLS